MGSLLKFPDVTVISNSGYTVRNMINGIEHVVEYDDNGRVTMVQDTEDDGSFTRTVWDFANQKIYSETSGPRA